MQCEDDVGVAPAGTAVQHGDVPHGARVHNLPFPVQPEVVGGDFILHVGDVHLGAVVAVGADQQGTELHVEREVGDVDVAGGPEDTAGLPVQASLRIQKDADPFEVWHQLVRPVIHNNKITYIQNYYKIVL